MKRFTLGDLVFSPETLTPQVTLPRHTAQTHSRDTGTVSETTPGVMPAQVDKGDRRLPNSHRRPGLLVGNVLCSTSVSARCFSG
jgi:hypothetical protein